MQELKFTIDGKEYQTSRTLLYVREIKAIAVVDALYMSGTSELADDQRLNMRQCKDFTTYPFMYQDPEPVAEIQTDEFPDWEERA